VSLRKTASTILLTAGALFLAPSPSAHAAVLTYTETIEDISVAPILDFFDPNRDLLRTRTLGNGIVLVEDDDAAIVSENAVTDSWGVSTFAPFSLNHIFVADSVTSFISATLTLEVFGAEGSLGDLVFVDFPFPLGILNAAGDNAPATTTLTTDIIGNPDIVNFLLGLFLADSTLSVGVVPLLFDFMSIHSSTLSVTYEAPVPEPAMGLLTLASLFALGGRGLIRRYRS
jgi:hypothetical protein